MKLKDLQDFRHKQLNSPLYQQSAAVRVVVEQGIEEIATVLHQEFDDLKNTNPEIDIPAQAEAKILQVLLSMRENIKEQVEQLKSALSHTQANALSPSAATNKLDHTDVIPDHQKILTPVETELVLEKLYERYAKFPWRCPINTQWEGVLSRLKLPENRSKLWSLYQSELKGGEPALTDFNVFTGELTFDECFKEMTEWRTYFCYDAEGEKKLYDKQKKALLLHPNSQSNLIIRGNAVEAIKFSGMDLMTGVEYQERFLKDNSGKPLDFYDQNCYTWLKTENPDLLIKGFAEIGKHDGLGTTGTDVSANHIGYRGTIKI